MDGLDGGLTCEQARGLLPSPDSRGLPRMSALSKRGIVYNSM